ncbi:MAG: hypothetical protein ACM357_08925, partial [Gemmatimonadota bacterium]
MIHVLVPREQDWAFVNYLAGHGAGLAGRMRVLHYESLPERRTFERGTWVFSALDQLGPGMERLVRALAGRLDGKPGIRLFNDPRRTLLRHDLLAALASRGLNGFRVVRAGAPWETLRYPVFVRAERNHGGNISPLLRDPKEVRAWLGRAVVQGYDFADLLVAEFHDTASPEGDYRKYAAFIVGERILPRSLACGRSWMLKHEHTEFSEGLLLEERAYLHEDPHAAQLAEVVRLAGVDYGRIDYAIDRGRVQTWEINLNPTIGRSPGRRRAPFPAELEPLRDANREFFYRNFNAAWEAYAGSVEGAPVAVSMDAELI